MAAKPQSYEPEKLNSPFNGLILFSPHTFKFAIALPGDALKIGSVLFREYACNGIPITVSRLVAALEKAYVRN